MTSEDTGLGSLTPTLAGYLGKVQERVSSLDNCPWCASKGLVSELRSYRVNFHESITLCTNPQCLFPLVSRPLEQVFAELVQGNEQIRGKRKNGHVLQGEDVASPASKRPRSVGDEPAPDNVDLLVAEALEVDGTEFKASHDTSEETLGSTIPSEGLFPSSAPARHGDSTEDKSDDVLVPLRSPAKPTATGATALVASAAPLSSAGTDGAVLASRRASEVMEDAPFRQATGHGAQCGIPMEDPMDNNVASPIPNEPAAQKKTQPLDSDGTAAPLTEGTTVTVQAEAPPPVSEWATDPEKTAKDAPHRPAQSAPLKGPEKLVLLPPRLFWRNSDNLCWLDTLLVALVHCRNLRDHRPTERPQKSAAWDLVKKYDEICAAVQAQQHTGTDGVVTVPERVLQNAYSELQSIRMSVFTLLQPRLQCPLGGWETPVFALPALMACDSWVESLFEVTFHWEFECTSCQSISKTRVTKPLPTFTHCVADWHPDKAAHLAPCNLCHKKNQRRTMVLDRVPPVFALHFVEGLPNDDLQAYSFNRQGSRYSVSTVIQYTETIKHFVTWIRTPSGLWQEFDDLKHPVCKTHAQLPVPAQEMHIVFWEVDEHPTRHTCTSPATVWESPPSANTADIATPPAQSADQSYDYILSALSPPVEGSVAKEPMVDFDASIGSATLLDTFEGLSHADIVTLTLVEVKVDSEGKPLTDVARTSLEVGSPDTSDVTSDTAPQETPSEVLSSSGDDLSSDPTFVPASSKRKRQARAPATKKRPKAAPRPRAAPKHSKNIVPPPSVATAVAEETAPTAALAAATVSSSNTSPPPTRSRKIATPLPASLQPADRWSYLLAKHPQSLANARPAQCPAPKTPERTRPAVPANETSVSTIQVIPTPAKRPAMPPLVRPQMRVEGGELPLKSAGMYNGFVVNSSTASTFAPQHTVPWQQETPHAAQRSDKSLNPLYAASPTPPKTQTAIKMASRPLPSPGATVLPDNRSTTDVLRLKLLKKLKAKKKKLEMLNLLLSQKGGPAAPPRPDSTDRRSPQAVSSSTTNQTNYDEFFSDLLSPASTVSHRSPDSTGLLEMLAADQSDHRLKSTASSQLGSAPHCTLPCSNEDFLEEFISGAATQQQTETETQALRELDLFF